MQYTMYLKIFFNIKVIWHTNIIFDVSTYTKYIFWNVISQLIIISSKLFYMNFGYFLRETGKNLIVKVS